MNTQVDRLKAEIYQSSRNARIKLFSPPSSVPLLQSSCQRGWFPTRNLTVDCPDRGGIVIVSITTSKVSLFHEKPGKIPLLPFLPGASVKGSAGKQRKCNGSLTKYHLLVFQVHFAP